MKTLYLSEPAAREDRHNRQVTCRGFARKDGLLDIEGELIDTMLMILRPLPMG